MKKTLRKLVLDRETIMPLQPDALAGVGGGQLQAPRGPSVGIICSNCVSAPVPTQPRPPQPGGGTLSALGACNPIGATLQGK
jgi:hypothetical protein